MEADGEWSDGSDDALKSGSATGVSDGEDESKNEEKKTIPSSKLLKTDPVNAILDKIDAELGAMKSFSHSSHSKSSKPDGKMQSIQKAPTTSSTVNVSTTTANLIKPQQQNTEALQKGKSDVTNEKEPVKDGETYHSDLDSVAAEQIDEKFKEIMKKKRGGYLQDLKVPKSNEEKNKNDDLKSNMNHSKVESSLVHISPELPHASHNQFKFSGYASDLDSIKTEDFENKFSELLVKDGSCDSVYQGQTTLSGLRPYEQTKLLSKVETSLKTTPITINHTDNKIPPSSFNSNEDTIPKTILVKKDPTPPRSMLSIYGRPSDQQTQGTSTPTCPPSSIGEQKKKKKKGVMFETDSVDETCKEIERESARIQLEMGKERRANSPSRLSTKPDFSSSLPLPTASPTIPDLMKTPTIYEDENEKQALDREVKLLREALHCSRLELRECQANLKETREKAENARTQLMLTEFKKHNADKDLERVNEEVEKQKSQSKVFDEQLDGKLREVQEFRSLGLSVTEVKTMKEEYNSLLTKSRSFDAMQLERDELVRLLNLGKEDLFHEQKQGRIQKEELQLEVESITSQLEEVQSVRDDLKQKLNNLEFSYKRLEEEKNQILKEKATESDVLKRQIFDAGRRNLCEEVENLKQDLHSYTLKMTELEECNSEKEEINLRLKDQNIELQQLLAKEEESREMILQDHKRTLLNLRKETDAAMMQLRESMFLEKQKALENLREEIENDRRDSMKRSDEKLSQILAENGKIITSKNEEVMRIQGLLKNLEDEKRDAEQKVEDRIRQQVAEAVGRERGVQQTEREWAIRREKDTLTAEFSRKLEESAVLYQKQSSINDELNQQLKTIQQEVEEQRHQLRQASKDKMVAVTRAKETMRNQTNVEIERVKEKVKDDHKREIGELKESVKSLEAEVEKLRTEKQQLCRVEREVNSTLDRTERTVINEINEECRRSATVLGISPRKVHIASFKAENSVTMGENPSSSKYRTPVTSSLANLRACNEELRTHLYELKQELGAQKSLYQKLQKEKDEELDTLRRKLEKEKSEEIDHLKERLVREQIIQMTRLANQYVVDSSTDQQVQRSPDVTWQNNLRENSPEYFIQRYEQEISKDKTKHSPSPDLQHINDVQQEEIHRLEREIKKLAQHRGNRKPPKPPTKRDVKKNGFDKSLKQQTNLLLQHTDTPSFYSPNFYTGSVPDLTSADLYRQVPLKARLSAERENISSTFSKRLCTDDLDIDLTDILSKPRHKISEMNELQSKLTNQNKELMELERAYNQLNRNYDQRSSSPTLHFRSSR